MHELLKNLEFSKLNIKSMKKFFSQEKIKQTTINYSNQ